MVLRTLTEDEQSARASALADARARRSKSAVWPRKKPRAATPRNSRNSRSVRPPRLARKPRKNAIAPMRKRRRRLNARPRSVSVKPRRNPQHPLLQHPPQRLPPVRLQLGPALPERVPQLPAPVPRLLELAQQPERRLGLQPVAADGSDEDEAPRMVRRPGGGPARPVIAPKPTHKPGPAKERGRLTLSTALNADDVRERSIASFRRRTQRLKGPCLERTEGKARFAK